MIYVSRDLFYSSWRMMGCDRVIIGGLDGRIWTILFTFAPIVALLHIGQKHLFGKAHNNARLLNWVAWPCVYSFITFLLDDFGIVPE